MCLNSPEITIKYVLLNNSGDLILSGVDSA